MRNGLYLLLLKFQRQNINHFYFLAIFREPEVVPAPFYESPPKAYYACLRLAEKLCQKLESIGPIVFEKNGNKKQLLNFLGSKNSNFRSPEQLEILQKFWKWFVLTTFKI